jgi:hypothetical protein
MRNCPSGLAIGQTRLDMAAFEYRQAQEIQSVFAEHGVRYLFLGKSGAILLGFPDTTQDADLYVDKQRENCNALIPALHELGFELNETEDEEIRRGKDFIQLKNGPFDLDLIFAPDGIERFEDACRAGLMSRVFPSATWMTSLRASAQRTEKRTKSL